MVPLRVDLRILYPVMTERSAFRAVVPIFVGSDIVCVTLLLEIGHALLAVRDAPLKKCWVTRLENRPAHLHTCEICFQQR